MPFTVSPSSYKGGDYLFQGISNAANSMSDALQKYADDKAKVGMADMTVDFAAKQFPGVISPEDLQRYHKSNAKEKAYIALGVQSNMKNLLESHAQEWQNRTNAAHANYYIQAAAHQAAEAAGGGSPGKGKIWSDELGGYATPAQAARAAKLTPEGQIQSNYGLTTPDIFNSKIHEAGTAVKDPTTGALKFTNDPKGDQIRIGGEKGVIMPRAEHEIYKRQLEQRGYDPATGLRAGGGPGAGGAGGDPIQAQAISILQQNGKPLTPANINYVKQQLGGGGGGGGGAPRAAAPQAAAPAGGGSKWLQGTDAQGQPYWYTNEGDYSATPPNG